MLRARSTASWFDTTSQNLRHGEVGERWARAQNAGSTMLSAKQSRRFWRAELFCAAAQRNRGRDTHPCLLLCRVSVYVVSVCVSAPVRRKDEELTVVFEEPSRHVRRRSDVLQENMRKTAPSGSQLKTRGWTTERVWRRACVGGHGCERPNRSLKAHRLEVSVPDGSGHPEHPLHPPHAIPAENLSPEPLDPFPLRRQLRLVVGREGLCGATAAEDGAAVAGVAWGWQSG